MVYKANSRIVGDTQRNSVLIKTKQEKNGGSLFTSAKGYDLRKRGYEPLELNHNDLGTCDVSLKRRTWLESQHHQLLVFLGRITQRNQKNHAALFDE